MRAVVFHRPGDVRVDNIQEPKIEKPEDILIRVTSTAICRSDLHILNGLIPQKKPLVMGHEFMGIVEELGTEVTALKKGDRVVVPFPIACGACFFCHHGLPGHCENSNPKSMVPKAACWMEKAALFSGIPISTEDMQGPSGVRASPLRKFWTAAGSR